MAICASRQGFNRLTSRLVLTNLKYHILNCGIHKDEIRNVTTLETDVVDDFTTNLIQQKLQKWKKISTKVKLLNEQHVHVKVQENNSYVANCCIGNLDVLLKDALEMHDIDDVKALAIRYKEHGLLPPYHLLLQLLNMCSQNGDKFTLLMMINLYSKCQPDLLESNSYFKHYIAQATWVKGNITEALTLFEDVFRTNAYLRKRIRLMLRHLIFDGVSNRSEAALLNIINFCHVLVRDFQDLYPLSLVWQACILSEWFTDQTIALKLLEESEALCKIVTNYIPYVVTKSLQNRQDEVVYRLLEIFLKFKLKIQYSRLLISLFDCRVKQGDLRGCSEIIQWSIKHNVELPTILHENFLKLLLLGSSNSIMQSAVQDILKPAVKPYHLKF